MTAPTTRSVQGPIVIIGGGVIGCSLAFHLVKHGHDNVTVIEAGQLGEGSTAKATGGIRQQFSSRLNADISHEAVDYFTNFESRVGEPFNFRQHGYLFLLSTEAQHRQFEMDIAMQGSLGIDVRLLDRHEIADLMPGVRTDDLLGGAYTPDDGSGSPTDVTMAFARQAKRRGAVFHLNTRVTDIERATDGTCRAVTTHAGERVPASTVVNAAGPWAAKVGRLGGMDLPVEPHPRQAFGIAPIAQLSPSMPLTVDLASGAYVHPETAGGIIGGNDRDAPVSEEATVDWNLVENLAESLSSRIPWMEAASITTGWSGLREMTPDDHAIIGPVAESGWWNAVGFSGHGFMQAPVVGEHLSRWMLGLGDHRDLSALSLDRFTTGRLNSEMTVF